MRKTKEERRKILLEALLHILVWLMIFFIPPMMFVRDEDFFPFILNIIPFLIGPFTLAIVFYANYLWLVPSFLMKRQFKPFVAFNIILIMGVGSLHIVWNHNQDKFMDKLWESHKSKTEIAEKDTKRSQDDFNVSSGQEEHVESQDTTRREIEMAQSPNENQKDFSWSDRIRRPRPNPGWFSRVVFSIRDIILYFLAILLASIMHMSYRFRKAEIARQQAELKNTEIELQFLRNQMSPHFLLNTLNNIYALVQMDQEKAQKAIYSLSRLLNHMLYQGKDTFVPLEREMEFLRYYVDLMKLRVSENVKIELEGNLRDGGQMPVAPMLFIALVENAFKHGICAEGGHISISFDAYPEKGIIKNCIRNSNHPRESKDANDHGAGLTLTQRRLELLYPDKYEWEKGVDQKTNEYYSNLTICV